MQVISYGAAREVTGSMHLIDNGTQRVILDCGMFQGRRRKSAEKNRVLPFEPNLITNIVLSHAHIDHSGRIPLMTKQGFLGNIICTRPTVDACRNLLLDSAHIQESDAQFVNYKTVKSFLSQLKSSEISSDLTNREIKKLKNTLKTDNRRINDEVIYGIIKRFHLETVEPLYNKTDAENALSGFQGAPYRKQVTIGKDMTVRFYDAGHIMGSAISIIKSKANGRRVNIAYTGDMGRFGTSILRDPELDFDEADRHIDLLIMESTYGNRKHEPVADMAPILARILTETCDRGGSVIIPAFAFGRTQELVYCLHEIYRENMAPKMPVYVDSPLANRLTKVYGEHPEVYDREANRSFLEKGLNPFMFDQIRFVQSVEESMALNRDQRPHVVLSASGMCEAGRILHHLRHKIHNEKNTILIVGYMAAHTLGRRILELGTEYAENGRVGDPPLVKFFNKEYPIKARVAKLGGFSAHGDRDELLRFLKNANLNIKRIAVVHGEEDQSVAFADHLKSLGHKVLVPKAGEAIRV